LSISDFYFLPIIIYSFVYQSFPVLNSQILIDLTDTSSVCNRNSIADISFYDSNNFVTKGLTDYYNRFPFLFTEKNRQIQIKEKVLLTKHLKTGNDLPPQHLHEDWIIGIILIASFLYSILRTTTKSILPDVYRFFLLRGKKDSTPGGISGLFNWQSIIYTLISFLIIGLFVYCIASYYNFIPAGVSGILFWVISFGIIITAATLRHIVCIITGRLSGEKEVFREYLFGVYHSYRFSAFFLFVFVILLIYTLFFPARACFISGISILGVMYLISVVRLMIIFLNRNISIFYLILYLCALEILPVLISVKYFTGLF
jgi:hypothetical protein